MTGVTVSGRAVPKVVNRRPVISDARFSNSEVACEIWWICGPEKKVSANNSVLPLFIVIPPCCMPIPSSMATPYNLSNFQHH